MSDITLEEALEAIRNTNLIAVRNANSGDELECPFCSGNCRVIGHAYPEPWYPEPWYPSHEPQHDESCIMARAWLMKIKSED